METIKLGELVPADAPDRDAIHIAVKRMVAVSRMKPGQRLANGLVDPYLQKDVMPGESYWLCLFPQTITSLFHVWHHSAFPLQGEHPAVGKMAESEKWLREYAIRWNCYEKDGEKAYQDLIENLKAGHLSRYGSGCYCLEDVNDADQLRFHAERLLGIRVNWDNFSFSCSC
jgi:hypothetical protein